MHRRTAVLVALPQPRHAASAAPDVVASHRGLHGSVLSIEGARTYASGIITGAVAVFLHFQRAQPGEALAGRGCLLSLRITFARGINDCYEICYFLTRMADCMPALGSMDRHR